MKVLYYNWADNLDGENRGGGVTYYQRNLMRELDKQDVIEATFLSSGLSFDVFNCQPRWEQTRYGPPHDRSRRYEIVNSGVLAPSQFSFGNPEQINHPATSECFLDFMAATGPYDFVHFNNLEGLPAKVLELKSRWPQTRIVMSLHNYYPFCPQVHLWHQGRELCDDFENGKKCESCLPHRPSQSIRRSNFALAYRMKRIGIHPESKVFKAVLETNFRLRRKLFKGQAPMHGWRVPLAKETPVKRDGPGPSPGEVFAKRRAAFIDLLNLNCDHVLCVSDATRKLAERYGVRPDLLHTQYIGTPMADQFGRKSPATSPLRSDGTISLGYLGYMRREKGFFFLLEALEALPDDVAQRIRLVVAAKKTNAKVMERLATLGNRLRELIYFDGYSRQDLDGILSNIDLGVIPVMWSDNLPQVAIEMHSHRIPLLTSELGGVQELSKCAQMVFQAGNVEDFQERLFAVFSGEVDWEKYWVHARVPVTMERHVNDLQALYSAPPDIS